MTSAVATLCRSRSRVAALAALALILAACGSSASPAPPSVAGPATDARPPSAETPSSSGAPSSTPGVSSGAGSSPTPVDPVALFRQIGDQMAVIRQLDWKQPIEPKLIDEAEARRILAADYEKNVPPGTFEGLETLYRGLGLMTGNRHLLDLTLDAMAGQVLGFYRQDDRTLYVVERSGGMGAIERYTISHELTHALQDQHFGLGALGLDAIGEDDRVVAGRSLPEGDASLASLYWVQQNLSLADLGEVTRAAADPVPQAALDALPPIVRESMLFPYVNGVSFVMGLQLRGGWPAVDAAYRTPPISTEQVLHPEKYAAHEKPVPISLPADLATRLGIGWSLAAEDTFGEMGLGVWLRQANDRRVADAGATGWGGDRVGLYRGPDGAWGIVLRTAWDDPAAATRFAAAAKPVVAALPNATLTADAQGPVVLVGSDATVLAALGKATGKE